MVVEPGFENRPPRITTIERTREAHRSAVSAIEGLFIEVSRVTDSDIPPVLILPFREVERTEGPFGAGKLFSFLTPVDRRFIIPPGGRPKPCDFGEHVGFVEQRFFKPESADEQGDEETIGGIHMATELFTHDDELRNRHSRLVGDTERLREALPHYRTALSRVRRETVAPVQVTEKGLLSRLAESVRIRLSQIKQRGSDNPPDQSRAGVEG